MKHCRVITRIAAFGIATIMLLALLPAAALAAEETIYIGEEKAKTAALKHAKVSARNATFLKVSLDYDDGVVVYEVEFYNGKTEYDYEIDAVSGRVRKYDRELEYYTIPKTKLPAKEADTYIGEEKAKSIALAHADILVENATFLKAHLDHDDGMVVYDVEFYSGNVEYDYEINAVNGDIVEHDRELEYYERPKAAAANPQPEQTKQAAANKGTGSYIGTAKAKSIALNAAGLSASQVRDFSAELDRENGKMVYEVEFESGRMEYEYEIDAVSGKILKSKKEYDD